MNEIQWANYWENFKFASELARYLPPEHPKRKKLESQLNNLLNKLNGKQQLQKSKYT